VARAPVFWAEVELVDAALPEQIASSLSSAGIATRYVASAERPSLALGTPLELHAAPAARPAGWAVRERGAPAPTPTSDGTWFLRSSEGGVAADREVCGDGVGTRLAVIDDDAAEADALELDAEVLVRLDKATRAGLHGALMVAWASGARGFAGVAPGASRRLYLVPKPGIGVLATPLAILRAVMDGADVVVCATYVEGSTSPMLDDALSFAACLGRGGRGAAVVMPTGRETSSPPGSLHASFSLGLGEPASDPRVFCVAPSARGEGWFLWRDRGGKWRPFANRGPAVRWLAPGDDVAFPFGRPGAAERLFHAESSGACAIAAGVLLLVLAQNRSLRLGELAAVLDATLVPVPDRVSAGARVPLADPADVLPLARDRDGHDAKHGLGRLDAARACLVVADPVAAGLVAMGDDAAARAYRHSRRYPWSKRLARWLARALLNDREAALALRVVLRHLRLVGTDESRRLAHGEGAIVRQLVLLARRLLETPPIPFHKSGHLELQNLHDRLRKFLTDRRSVSRLERSLARRAAGLFKPHD
jgi:hypothetical protein